MSARTGSGIETLRERLSARAAALPPRLSGRRASGCRSIGSSPSPGVGTVVTGTSWSGRLRRRRLGGRAALRVCGPGAIARELRSCRGAERAQRPNRGRPGRYRAPARSPGETCWSPTSFPGRPRQRWMSRSRSSPVPPRPSSSRTRVRLHLGTAEVMARVLPRLADRAGWHRHGPAHAGETAGGPRARIASCCAAIVRLPPSVVAASSTPRRPARRSAWPEGLASPDPAERFRAALARHPEGISRRRLPLLLGLPEPRPSEVAQGGAHRPAARRPLGDEATRSKRSGSGRLGLLREYHRHHISELGMPLETLRHSLRARDVVVEAALSDFAAEPAGCGESMGSSPWRVSYPASPGETQRSNGSSVCCSRLI